MTGSIESWSTTASDNDDADGDINWREGQNSKTVNGSARQMMGRVKEWLDDMGGLGTVGGTANAITLTLNSGYTTLVTGLKCVIQPTADNTGAVTLNVNGIGAKAIRKFDTTGEVALAAKDLQDGNFYFLIYDSAADTGSGAWIALNPTIPAFSAVATSGSASDLSTGTLPDARLPVRLGNLATTITDWNDATGNGWYKGNAATNAPGTSIVGTTSWCFGQTITYDASMYIVQIVTAASSGPGTDADTKMAMRTCKAGTWTDWFRLRWSETEQQALWDARYPSLTNLASTSASKGASLVGIQDSGAKYTATTVEAALAEIATSSKIGGLMAGLPYGSVGTPVFGYIADNVTAGTSYAGSDIHPCGGFVDGGISAGGNASLFFYRSAASLPGTWIAVGTQESARAWSVTEFVRIA